MPIRPPPLKLKYDNRFPLPLPSAKQAPVHESFFAKLYQANWRNLVIAFSGLNVLRYSYAAYTAYSDMEIDQFEHAAALALVSRALCAMYAAAALIELFGVLGLSSRRFGLVRAYVLLAFVGAALATAGGALRAASFFLNAQELLYECVALALAGQAHRSSHFRGAAWPGLAAGLRAAQVQCGAAWTREAHAQLACALLFGFAPALAHYLMLYTHYRQATDARHAAYMAPRKPSPSARPPQQGYAPVDTVEVVTTARVQRSARHRPNAQRAAVAPGMTTVNFATRGIVRAHRPPALVSLEPAVFSPLRSAAARTAQWLSPAAPAYGAPHARPARVW